MNCKIWWEGGYICKIWCWEGGQICNKWWGGGSDLQLTLAKYAWVGVRFAIYPSEKHLPKIGNMIHLQFTLMMWLIAFMTNFKSSHMLHKILV